MGWFHHVNHFPRLIKASKHSHLQYNKAISWSIQPIIPSYKFLQKWKNIYLNGKWMKFLVRIHSFLTPKSPTLISQSIWGVLVHKWGFNRLELVFHPRYHIVVMASPCRGGINDSMVISSSRRGDHSSIATYFSHHVMVSIHHATVKCMLHTDYDEKSF